MKKFLAFTVVAVLVTGCDAAQFFDQLNQEWNAMLIVLRGGESPLAKHAPRTKDSTRTLSPSEAAARAKQNSELLQEMFRVVYNRELTDRAQFGSYLDTLNQGASIEGIYNGFTHSSDYRNLEVANPVAKPDALAFFAGELAETELLMSQPTVFNSGSAQPLARLVTPEEVGNNEIVFEPSPSSSPAPSPMLSADRHAVRNLELKYMMISRRFDLHDEADLGRRDSSTCRRKEPRSQGSSDLVR